MTKLQIPSTPAIINGGGVRMGRDKAKQYASNRAYDKRTFHERSLRIRKDSGIVEALEAMTSLTGVSASKYMLNSITNSLLKDGYLKPLDETVAEISEE